MKLTELLRGVTLIKAEEIPEKEILGVSYDSRETKPGELFVALPGYKTDGHCYIAQALEKGAVAVLCGKRPAGAGPYLETENPRAALAVIAANWYGHPAEEMTVIGVTGTNGKTTTTYLLKAVLEHAVGAKVGLIGTNRNLIGDEEIPAHRTTPEACELQGLLRRMADSGCTHVVMEVSSHALALHRTDAIRFRVGIFTNLTQDHLDFHGTMEAYRAAKGKLFEQSELAILNLDDEAGLHYKETAPCPVFTYSENKSEADLFARNIRLFPTYVEFEAVMTESICRMHLPIPGGFTIYNALGVIACSLQLGIGLNAISAALRRAEGVKGRIEVVQIPADYTVLIDYAHTPNALENILMTARAFTQGRLICLFGCGGDRDRTKRPIMGAIAADLADFVVVTSDNPRTEQPEAIIQDIRQGMEESRTPYHVEPDRRAAIRYTLAAAKAGDVVVLAGKGHETYQEKNGERIHLDEREEIAAFFYPEKSKRTAALDTGICE